MASFGAGVVLCTAVVALLSNSARRAAIKRWCRSKVFDLTFGEKTSAFVVLVDPPVVDFFVADDVGVAAAVVAFVVVLGFVVFSVSSDSDEPISSISSAAASVDCSVVVVVGWVAVV